MIRRVVILSLLLLFMLLFMPAGRSYATGSNDAPLTLLNKPQTSGLSTQNQAIVNKDEVLRDIRGPVLINEQPPYLLIAGIICLVLLVVVAIFLFLRKRGPATPPAIPPWEKALQELADAKELQTPERGLQYMSRASQILRRYIESRFAIQSTRQTTREFLQSLTKIGVDSPIQRHKEELQSCLELADMAKFAHHIPQLSNLEKMEDAVTTFVKTTEPTEPDKASGQSKQSKRYAQGLKRSKRGRS